jgi:hypothetical protein
VPETPFLPSEPSLWPDSEDRTRRAVDAVMIPTPDTELVEIPEVSAEDG